MMVYWFKVLFGDWSDLTGQYRLGCLKVPHGIVANLTT